MPSGEQLTDKTIKEILRLGQTIGAPQSSGELMYAVIPSDCKVESLERFQHTKYAERPHRKIGTVAVLDADSFIEYYTLFSDAHSRVFADETKSSVLGVLDYHGIGENAPRWGEHRVRLDLRKSPEWVAWASNDGQRHNQMDFAEFLEDNTPDIVEPNAATMLEVARTLSAKTDVDFGSAIRTANGSVQFKYTEQVKGTYGAGNVDIPEQFVIAIPVYVGCDRVRITARLRYRITSGKLTFWYNLLRAGEVERNAFLSARNAIAETLKITIVNGGLS